jgi:hypothetical protein
VRSGGGGGPALFLAVFFWPVVGVIGPCGVVVGEEVWTGGGVLDGAGAGEEGKGEPGP